MFELLLDKGKTISECSREIAKPSIGIEISELTISSSEDDVKLHTNLFYGIW